MTRKAREAELAAMCALEIRRTQTLVKMTVNDGVHDVDEAVDMEFWDMLTRLRGKPITESDLPLLRELVTEMSRKIDRSSRDVENFRHERKDVG
jgi:hypothetical protein